MLPVYELMRTEWKRMLLFFFQRLPLFNYNMCLSFLTVTFLEYINNELNPRLQYVHLLYMYYYNENMTSSNNPIKKKLGNIYI